MKMISPQLRLIYKRLSLTKLHFFQIISLFIFLLTLVSFSFFLFKDIFLDPNFTGDETKYMGDLLTAKSSGISNAISNGTSIPYLIITYFLDYLLNNPLYSLRATSLLCGIVMFVILIIFNSRKIHIGRHLKISIYLWLIYLFVIQATIFVGVNDILLDLFGTFLFITCFSRFKKPETKLILTGLFLALMLATRKMAITYIIVLVLLYLSIIIYYKGNLFNIRNLVVIAVSFTFFLLSINFYPLLNDNKFSFDDKILQGKVNWAQWDYHNSILIDQGKQNRFQHVNIKETEKYLIQNGPASLPTTFAQMIWFNEKLTMKEFFIDVAIAFKYIFRQTGLIVFAFSIFLVDRIRKIRKIKSVKTTDFIYLFSASYFFIICFIVIANVQARWFMLFMPIMILLIGKDLSKLKIKNQILFSIGNNILLSVMCFPYLFEKISYYF